MATGGLKSAEKKMDEKLLNGLSAMSRAWCESVCARFELDEHHHRLLGMAAQQWDAWMRCRITLQDEGEFFRDRWGQPRVHPGVEQARKCINTFRSCVIELGLDAESPAERDGPILKLEDVTPQWRDIAKGDTDG